MRPPVCGVRANGLDGCRRARGATIFAPSMELLIVLVILCLDYFLRLPACTGKSEQMMCLHGHQGFQRLLQSVLSCRHAQHHLIAQSHHCNCPIQSRATESLALEGIGKKLFMLGLSKPVSAAAKVDLCSASWSGRTTIKTPRLQTYTPQQEDAAKILKLAGKIVIC